MSTSLAFFFFCWASCVPMLRWKSVWLYKKRKKANKRACESACLYMCVFFFLLFYFILCVFHYSQCGFFDQNKFRRKKNAATLPHIKSHWRRCGRHWCLTVQFIFDTCAPICMLISSYKSHIIHINNSIYLPNTLYCIQYMQIECLNIVFFFRYLVFESFDLCVWIFSFTDFFFVFFFWFTI